MVYITSSFNFIKHFVSLCCSFIVSFSNNAPDPEKDCAMVQEFFSKMEAAFRAHPLWSGCSEEELDSAGDVSISMFLFLSGLFAFLCHNHCSFVYTGPREVCHDKAIYAGICFKH